MRELLKLRSEVSRLRNESHELVQAGPASTENDAIDVEAKELARKGKLLKQLVARMPEKSIPELQYLGPQVWMDRANLADLETDAGIAKVLSELREDAKHLLAALGMTPALRGYAAANSGQLPTDISQLKPYSIVGMSDDVLQRYQIVDHQVVVWVNFGVLGLRNEIKRAGGRAASQTARAPLRRRFV
jgi:hypothetical protein